MKAKLFIMTAVAMFASCSTPRTDDTETPFIGKQEITIPNGRLTPEALWAMGRIGGVSVSPDGKKAVYTVSYYSVPENKSHQVIYTMNLDGSENRMLTTSTQSEREPCWIKGGTQIAYLSSENGKSEIWSMNTDGSNRKVISSFDGDIEGFSFSPDESKVMFVAQIKYGQRTADIYPDLPKASGIIVNDLMYKHWDEWVETIPHPYIASFDGNRIGEAKDILEGQPYECPMKPFGGMEQLAWSPDSKSIAYTCRKKTGKEYAFSTDSDIYLYHIESGDTENLCKDYTTSQFYGKVFLGNANTSELLYVCPQSKDENKGYDINPRFSPDGKYIAWQSMERDGYESDRNRLCVFNLDKKLKTYVTESFESGVDDYCWNNDSQSLYFIGVWHGTTMIYRTNLEGNIEKLTDGDYDYASVTMAGNNLITKRHSISMADEIYLLDTNTKKIAQLTTENKHIYDQLTMGKVEARWTPTTDGKKMLSWVIYPPHFDPNKKYPTLLFCEGGPQSPVSQFWSYRWNFQIMAANDYIIIAPNRRGLPGFGMEWLEQISGDYSGQCMKDYLAAIDDIAKEPYVDKEKLGCVGASFGGYSVYYLAGHHDKRFKAFIAHDGIFNMEQQYLETEEMWFAHWDMGGAYWEKNNPIAQRTFANSPHKFVDKWDTPILCIHGEKDYRILASQGMSAFNAAVMRGIPAELLLYPDENHWVLEPQNGILWQRTFFNWLDRWLK